MKQTFLTIAAALLLCVPMFAQEPVVVKPEVIQKKIASSDEDIANEYEVVWSSIILVDYDTNGERIIEDLTDVAFLNADKLSIELSNRIATMLNK